MNSLGQMLLAEEPKRKGKTKRFEMDIERTMANMTQEEAIKQIIQGDIKAGYVTSVCPFVDWIAKDEKCKSCEGKDPKCSEYINYLKVVCYGA